MPGAPFAVDTDAFVVDSVYNLDGKAEVWFGKDRRSSDPVVLWTVGGHTHKHCFAPNLTAALIPTMYKHLLDELPTFEGVDINHLYNALVEMEQFYGPAPVVQTKVAHVTDITAVPDTVTYVAAK
jgi:hypothetical protein